MAGEEDLDNLLALLNPSLLAGDFVFCTVENAQYGDFADLQPIASYQEEEGLSLLLARERQSLLALPMSRSLVVLA